MNTEKSDVFVEKWTDTVNPLKRASFTSQRRFQTSPEKLFPLLCPTTEYDWLPQWTCELLHSDSGYAEYNAVFKTRFFGPEEIWVCTRFEPNKAIDYTRIAEDVCMKMEITLLDHRDGAVTGQWLITAAALNEKGNPAVTQLESMRPHMETVLGSLDHYVNTGEMVA